MVQHNDNHTRILQKERRKTINTVYSVFSKIQTYISNLHFNFWDFTAIQSEYPVYVTGINCTHTIFCIRISILPKCSAEILWDAKSWFDYQEGKSDVRLTCLFNLHFWYVACITIKQTTSLKVLC